MNRYLQVRDLDVAGKRVFLRLDLNVPIKDGVIGDDTRIGAALPTIRHLLDRGASVVACSHLGRPKGKVVPELSLTPVAERLRRLLEDRTVLVASDTAGPDAAAKAANLRPGEVLMLENVRYEAGETAGDADLARRLRGLADLYVSDAFGALHRAHASVAALPRLFEHPAVGYLLEREVAYLEGALGDPARPYTAFLGGAKVSDKIPVLERLVEKVDGLGIGGAMAYTFLLARGVRTGSSLVEPELAGVCGKILDRAAERGVRLILPVDHVAAPSLEEAGGAEVLPAEGFPEGLCAFDVGPATREALGAAAGWSATIFWNGPMGVFERRPFDEGTVALARAVSASGAVSVVGGGDSVAAVHAAGVADGISHISTGGGASLELLAGKKLPGLEALALTA